jgi:opacity protein-like surface antigen
MSFKTTLFITFFLWVGLSDLIAQNRFVRPVRTEINLHAGLSAEAVKWQGQQNDVQDRQNLLMEPAFFGGIEVESYKNRYSLAYNASYRLNKGVFDQFVCLPVIPSDCILNDDLKLQIVSLGIEVRAQFGQEQQLNWYVGGGPQLNIGFMEFTRFVERVNADESVEYFNGTRSESRVAPGLRLTGGLKYSLSENLAFDFRTQLQAYYFRNFDSDDSDFFDEFFSSGMGAVSIIPTIGITYRIF